MAAHPRKTLFGNIAMPATLICRRTAFLSNAPAFDLRQAALAWALLLISLLAFAPPAAAVTAPASAAERQMQALSVASAAVVGIQVKAAAGAEGTV